MKQHLDFHRDIADYERGINDCKAGKPHKPDSKHYDLGYSDQYTTEQQQEANCEHITTGCK